MALQEAAFSDVIFGRNLSLFVYTDLCMLKCLKVVGGWSSVYIAAPLPDPSVRHGNGRAKYAVSQKPDRYD